MYTDTHFHMLSIKEKGIDPEAILTSMDGQGFEGIDIGTVADDLKARSGLLKAHPSYRLSAGIGPWGVGQDIETLKAQIRQYGPVCAIGEIGLDNHWKDYGSPEDQEQLFESQLDLAEELALPVIIHSREADMQMERILRRRTFPHGGIMHCFEGGRRLLDTALRKGFWISFSGVITYKHTEWLGDLLTLVPDDRLLLETDSPYLSPVPYRGKTDTPLYIHATYEKAAELRERDAKEIEALVRANFHAFLASGGGTSVPQA